MLCSPLRFICKFYYFECKVTLMSMRAHMLRARRNRLNSSMSQQQHESTAACASAQQPLSVIVPHLHRQMLSAPAEAVGEREVNTGI